MGGRGDENIFSGIRSLCPLARWRARMRHRGGKTARPWEPQRSRQEAQSPAATRPAGDGVFLLIDPVSRWDGRRCYAPDEDDTRGAPPCDPAMMVCLWRSAYGVGVLSRRTRALACARHRAFLAMVGQDRPDCRPSSACRTRHWEAGIDGWVAVGRLAGDAG